MAAIGEIHIIRKRKVWGSISYWAESRGSQGNGGFPYVLVTVTGVVPDDPEGAREIGDLVRSGMKVIVSQVRGVFGNRRIKWALGQYGWLRDYIPER